MMITKNSTSKPLQGTMSWLFIGTETGPFHSLCEQGYISAGSSRSSRDIVKLGTAEFADRNLQR